MTAHRQSNTASKLSISGLSHLAGVFPTAYKVHDVGRQNLRILFMILFKIFSSFHDCSYFGISTIVSQVRTRVFVSLELVPWFFRSEPVCLCPWNQCHGSPGENLCVCVHVISTMDSQMRTCVFMSVESVPWIPR